MALKDPSVLKAIPLLALLDEKELAGLAKHLDEIKYLAGQRLFSVGDQGGTMMIVESGRIELSVRDTGGQRVVLHTPEPGEFFGELSLLDNQPRSTDAIALENSTLVEIDRTDLEMLIKTHPDSALDLLTVLGTRLRHSTLLVKDRAVRNVNQEMQQRVTLGDRLADFLTRVAGDIRFTYVSVLWFGAWIMLNAGIIPGMSAFDPFPYGLLTMVVSLEAIFLSLFVLISQNRQAARDKVRSDIEYEADRKSVV